jgi:coenzyme F420-dependent glucose-6-phosphate dehydrogenase
VTCSIAASNTTYGNAPLSAKLLRAEGWSNGCAKQQRNFRVELARSSLRPSTKRHQPWTVVAGVSAMVEIGYSMSSEEHAPLDLVKYAKIAEDVGFSFALISDHYHPWISRQGHNSFVWSVIGAIATATDRLRVGTGVTCPLMRVHPAIVAQAAATAAVMMPGRFFLGVGTGENLNEHVLGEGWPDANTRRAMLEEAIDVLRALWSGGEHSHFGRFFTVDNARLYTLPDEPPEVMVAAGTRATAELAGRLGDGLVGTAPEPDLVAAFEHAGGRRKPRYGQLTVCWARSDEEARRIALEWWPNAGLTGDLSQELPRPPHFEQACQLVDESTVTKQVVCSSDVTPHLEAIGRFVDAGYDHVYIHQVGPDQEGFFRFFETTVLPQLV